MVALMCEVAQLTGVERVLEVGTGSGYAAAVLARLAATVYSVECLAQFYERARARLEALEIANVHLSFRDGSEGWPEQAPFDAIVVTAAPRTIPEALKSQLADGGRLVIPVGGDVQELRLVTRRGATFEERRLFMVRFVPLVTRP